MFFACKSLRRMHNRSRKRERPMTEAEHRAMDHEKVKRIKKELRDIGALRFIEARLASLDVGEIINDIGLAADA